MIAASLIFWALSLTNMAVTVIGIRETARQKHGTDTAVGFILVTFFASGAAVFAVLGTLAWRAA